jgi:hypothetical protein
MAARRSPGKVKVTGHGRVTVTGLRGTVKAVTKAAALEGGSGPSAGAATDLGKRLKEAGVYVAAIAAGMAGGWSESIPPAIRVGGGRSGVTITCRTGAAYPNEIDGVRHPTFDHDPWVENEHRPFFAPAADAGADGAAEIVAQVIDDWAIEHGFR